jgi:hypothetical protein
VLLKKPPPELPVSHSPSDLPSDAVDDMLLRLTVPSSFLVMVAELPPLVVVLLPPKRLPAPLKEPKLWATVPKPNVPANVPNAGFINRELLSELVMVPSHLLIRLPQLSTLSSLREVLDRTVVSSLSILLARSPTRLFHFSCSRWTWVSWYLEWPFQFEGKHLVPLAPLRLHLPRHFRNLLRPSLARHKVPIAGFAHPAKH